MAASSEASFEQNGRILSCWVNALMRHVFHWKFRFVFILKIIAVPLGRITASIVEKICWEIRRIHYVLWTITLSQDWLLELWSSWVLIPSVCLKILQHWPGPYLQLFKAFVYFSEFLWLPFAIATRSPKRCNLEEKNRQTWGGGRWRVELNKSSA